VTSNKAALYRLVLLEEPMSNRQQFLDTAVDAARIVASNGLIHEGMAAVLTSPGQEDAA
jgi:hypothetical protein